MIMLSQLQKTYLNLRRELSSFVKQIAPIVVIGVFSTWSYPALGQTSEIEFSGYRFDPLRLESGGAVILDTLGIEPDLRAAGPVTREADHWRLLQFFEVPDREARNELRSTIDLTLDRYADGVYVEKLSLDEVDQLRRRYGLRASVPYHPAFKLANSLRGPSLGLDRNFETEERERIAGLLLRAETFADADIDSIVAAITDAGAQDVLPMISSGRSARRINFRLEGDDAAIARALAEIAHNQDIRRIEEVGEFLDNNVETASANQSGDRTNPSIWGRDLTGDNQVISIFDSGIVEASHCFFKDPSIPGNVPGPNHRKLVEIRDQSNSYPDNLTHTTFVAGSAAGDHHQWPGTHDQRGGAWSAKLLIVNINDINEIVFADDTGGTIIAAPPSSLLAELTAASESAQVHSNSWEQSLNGYSLLAEDFDRFSKMNEDNLFIAAAGKDYRTWSAPPIAKNVLTVSAATADGSSIGDGYDEYPPSNRRKPDVAAVGCRVNSAMIDATGCAVTGPLLCATSFAAPHAAAIATLARQYYVEGHYPERSLQPTGSLLKATLINSARDVSKNYGFPSQREGWGVITLDRTLSFPDSKHKLWVKDVRSTDKEALGNRDLHEYQVTIGSGNKPLKVTLVWPDSPRTDGSGALVNNLDLVVISPDGTSEFFGNHFNTINGVSVPGGATDTVNNVEQVLVKNPSPGNWRIVVGATLITVVEEGLAGQGYALVATGDFRSQRIPKAPVLSLAGLLAIFTLGYITRKKITFNWSRSKPFSEP
jgi:hypothetical protein